MTMTEVSAGVVGVDGAVEVGGGGTVERVHVEAFLRHYAVDGVVQILPVAQDELDVALCGWINIATWGQKNVRGQVRITHALS